MKIDVSEDVSALYLYGEKDSQFVAPVYYYKLKQKATDRISVLKIKKVIDALPDKVKELHQL